ncbi:MAG: DUF5820 family protein [Haloarculaceae archaeon]
MDLPEGWRTWSESDDRVVLAYRPDVFDGAGFPPPCLPTLYVTRGRRDRRPGVAPDPPADAPWVVTLYLEPEVNREADRYEERGAALDGARDLAAAFAAGEVDYRSLYQVPRDDYLRKLDELTGRAD